MKNLMMAGRNISCSHVAFTSTRVMSTCAVEGQAVGTTLALCIDSNMTPSELRADKKKVRQLQQMLLRDDQTILGIKNEDSNDIARSAKVSASESIDASQPKNILSGVAYDKIGGVGNRWVALASSKPSITLSWDYPKKISSVQFTFFSGSNEIAQTQSAYILKNMHRGPQKDLVRDFNLVAILEDGSERELCQVRQNAQRLVRLNFDSISVKALRADFLATNGSPKVVVNEIRAYA